jgi:hypothetical protein
LEVIANEHHVRRGPAEGPGGLDGVLLETLGARFVVFDRCGQALNRRARTVQLLTYLGKPDFALRDQRRMGRDALFPGGGTLGRPRERYLCVFETVPDGVELGSCGRFLLHRAFERAAELVELRF